LTTTIHPLNSRDTYKYVVSFARSNGKWLFSRHKESGTWETQGGHVELSETPLEAAKRELYEECGATHFDITPVCDYCVSDERRSDFGQVFYADVYALGEMPSDWEMEVVCEFDTLPDLLTYHEITPVLWRNVQAWLKNTLSIEKSVKREGNIVLRPRELWTPFVQDYLRFLETHDFPAPRVVERDDYDALTFVEGEFVDPQKWSDDALIAVAKMVRKLHDLSLEYTPSGNAKFQPWFLHQYGTEPLIVSHGDIAPWNMVTTGGMPKTLIDWEYSGLVSPLSEFARVCWLFVQLCGDDLAAKYDLPSFEYRAKQVRMMCDVYGLTASARVLLTQRIIDVIVLETAEENIPLNTTPDSVGQLWGLV
jgi:8-oxo-dGTP pyrophosphatase MutT (NUDIX family)